MERKQSELGGYTSIKNAVMRTTRVKKVAHPQPTRNEYGYLLQKGYSLGNSGDGMASKGKSVNPAKMELLGHMTMGVTHDFNNLLTCILGNAQIGKMEITSDDRLNKLFDDISSAAEKAAELTHQLLAFSNDEYIEPKIVSLNDQLDSMNRMLSSMLGDNVSLTITCEKNLGLIEANPGQIQQVLVNLVLNARDAMPNGGELAIETSNIAPDKNWKKQHPDVSPGKYVMISVSDTGIGLSNTTKKVMFDEFFTTKPTGRGIGLSNVKRIVDQYSGKIAVSSTIGEGTVFRIYFPYLPKNVEPPSEIAFGDCSLRGDESILVVEDEPLIRDIAKAVLENQGYNVVCVTDGTEALKKDTTRFDLLITDIYLPDMDGRELVQQFGKLHTGFRVLYMSGYSTSHLTSRKIVIDENEFIPKPFTPSVLAKKVRQILDMSSSDDLRI